MTIAIPLGSAGFCPVCSLRRWLQAADIFEGAIFRRIWIAPAGKAPLPRGGINEIDPRTVARVIRKRASAAGFALPSLAATASSEVP